MALNPTMADARAPVPVRADNGDVWWPYTDDSGEWRTYRYTPSHPNYESALRYLEAGRSVPVSADGRAVQPRPKPAAVRAFDWALHPVAAMMYPVVPLL